jgi:hypothetical protein
VYILCNLHKSTWPADLISKNFEVTGISNALDVKDDSYVKMLAIGTVYVAQNGRPEF